MSMKINEKAELEKYSGQEAVVNIPDGVKKIGIHAFYKNQFIREVILPPSLTEIGIGAFDSSSIERIVIPAGVKIRYSAFENCHHLKSVTLPDDLERIDIFTFQRCDQLTRLELPPKLKEVGREAFDLCGITELRIPDSMTNIGFKAFHNMRNLERLYLPPTLRGISREAFSFCKKLKEVCIPEGVIDIEWDAFYGCINLEKVVLPKSLLSFSRGAFSGTKVDDCEEVQAACDRIAALKKYQKPDGFDDLPFAGMKFFYRAEHEIPVSSGLPYGLVDFKYEYDFTDSQMVYKNKDGRRALRLFISVPTFDSGDREWDSYRKLFLIPEDGKVTGVLIRGGSKIAKILTYSDIQWADEKTERTLMSTGIF